jgi:hypothetical protein
MLEFARAGGTDVPDPYYGGDEGFQRVYEMLHGACAGLLDRLLAERNDPPGRPDGSASSQGE